MIATGRSVAQGYVVRRRDDFLGKSERVRRRRSVDEFDSDVDCSVGVESAQFGVVVSRYDSYRVVRRFSHEFGVGFVEWDDA